MEYVIKHQLSQKAANRFNYVLDFLNRHPLKPKDIKFLADKNHNAPYISYGVSTNISYYIPLEKGALFSDNYADQRLYANTFKFNKDKIFAVSNTLKNSANFIQQNHLSFDIFNTLFFHLTRYEEIFDRQKVLDSSGWLKEEHQFLVRYQLEQIPVVDDLVAAFFEIITQKKIDQPTHYALTHDVDLLFKFQPFSVFFSHLLSGLYRKKGWQYIKANIEQYFPTLRNKQLDPYQYFEKMFRQDKRWKDKTTYFMSGGNTKFDNNYNIDSPAAQSILQLAKLNGYNIGLHPSYNAGFEARMYQNEKNKLASTIKNAIYNNRQHWLRWNWTITPYLLEINGIKKDSSLGFRRHIGYRSGTGFPYRLYDFKNEKSFDWLEQPLVLMDGAALNYANEKKLDFIEMIKKFILQNRKNTFITFNFHNNSFDLTTSSGLALRQFYETELEAICFG